MKLSHEKAFHSNLSPVMKPGEAEDISEVTNLVYKEWFVKARSKNDVIKIHVFGVRISDQHKESTV